MTDKPPASNPISITTMQHPPAYAISEQAYLRPSFIYKPIPSVAKENGQPVEGWEARAAGYSPIGYGNTPAQALLAFDMAFDDPKGVVDLRTKSQPELETYRG